MQIFVHYELEETQGSENQVAENCGTYKLGFSSCAQFEAVLSFEELITCVRTCKCACCIYTDYKQPCENFAQATYAL